jgi:phage tail sheath protein FI
MSDVYAALADIDDISLIALPGKNWPDNQSDYEHAIAHCQAKKDRMVLIQLRDDTTDFENISVPKDKYTTVYYPSATVSLQVGGGNTITQTVNTTGHVTGVFARTDSTKGAWTAPAGMHANIAGITQLTKDISQTKQESINPHGTNALRYIEGIPVVWGAHTRDDGIYTQVPVMRTAFLIADSLRDTLNRVVFAKNTEVLWSNVKAGVSGFMDTLFIQGAFQGATPAQAFEVAVGLGESMTQTDIDGGLLRVTVRFRPAKFAEFIEVSVEQLFDNAA